MDWADTRQVLDLWVKLREGLLDYCKQQERTRDEVLDCAEKLVVAHEAPLGWIERLVFTVVNLITIRK